MGAYVVQRLPAIAPVMLVVATVAFVLMHLAPGDPASVIAGPYASADDVARLRRQLGRDERLLVQLGRWYWRLRPAELPVAGDRPGHVHLRARGAWRSGALVSGGSARRRRCPRGGNILAEGRLYIQQAPWLVLAPGVAIMATILGLNLFGDGLRDALDPKLRGATGGARSVA